MIKIINPSRLTRQPFSELIDYLDQHEAVIHGRLSESLRA